MQLKDCQEGNPMRNCWYRFLSEDESKPPLWRWSASCGKESKNIFIPFSSFPFWTNTFISWASPASFYSFFSANCLILLFLHFTEANNLRLLSNTLPTQLVKDSAINQQVEYNRKVTLKPQKLLRKWLSQILRGLKIIKKQKTFSLLTKSMTMDQTG